MKRTLAALASAGLLTVGLTACGGGGEAEAFCERGEELGSSLDTSDPEAAMGLLEDLRDEAPSEIQGDMDTLVEAMDALQAGDLEGLDQEAVTEASENLEAYVTENCDV